MPYTPIDQVPVALRSQTQKVFDDAVAGFFTQLPRAIDQFNTAGVQTDTNARAAEGAAVTATAQATIAQTAAVAAVSVPSTAATSSTALTTGFGLRNLVLNQLGKTFKPGQQVAIASIDNPRNWMSGTVLQFDPATGSMQVDVLNGSTETLGVFPTAAAWSVSLVGAPAQTSQQQALSFVPVPMTALDMDLSQGEWFKKTINGNSNFTWSNVPPPPYGKVWVLELTITAGMVGFPASIRWVGGLTPTMLPGKRHKLVFSSTDGGATVDAAVLAGYSL